MASASAAVARLKPFLAPVIIPATAATVAYAVYKGDFSVYFRSFFTGPGKFSRIFALVVLLVNWKGLPLAWTVRVIGAMIQHFFVRQPHRLPPSALFHPVITKSHVTLLECDYNIHKSNSTYFADLDVSRSQLVSHLTAATVHKLNNNAQTRLVMDPSDPARPARGRLFVMLGAVHCSFKKELKPYQSYECWSRVLCWDRKWLFIVTHFVEAGAVRPRSWDANGARFGPTRKDADQRGPEDWEKKIHASAISKYVFKMGRLTIHPSVVLGASGLLPERPGGWTAPEATENGAAAPALPAGGDGEAMEWDWKHTEAERRKGWEFAQHFALLDGLTGEFDAGDNGALGRFSLG